MTSQASADGVPPGEPTAGVQGSIVTRGLTKRFGSFTAAADLDLSVQPGEIFGLLGPNGAGKTTTIKMLITLLPPSSGTAIVAGADIVRQPALVRRRIGYVPQLVSSDGSLTARENLRLSARLYHLPGSEREDAIAESLGFMGLSEVGDRLVRTYSGGMVRRLEIAQAMLHQPAVLVLDEPTVGLDPTARATVWDRVARLREDHRTTILLTTHYMDEADELCERIALLEAGRIRQTGRPDELKAAVGPGATLDDLFRALTGSGIEVGGTFRDIGRTRRTAQRLG
ncbi:MAG TPA: ATP-binding cassette domain-containing protein [Candidatus Limnocylindrales bacterium]|nr:ATP-binding cassette domain-containing protein [Candidatus Limnocylindrales bacterium]